MRCKWPLRGRRSKGKLLPIELKGRSSVNRAILLLSALSLTACSAASTKPVAFPTLPPLPAALEQECGPAKLLSDPSLSALVKADVDLAVAYAQCAARHGAVVKAYNDARRKMEEASREH